ncbi:hypothetical protein Droror1_Dr00002212 [Drosera rotundifolia]
MRGRRSKRTLQGPLGVAGKKQRQRRLEFDVASGGGSQGHLHRVVALAAQRGGGGWQQIGRIELIGGTKRIGRRRNVRC